MDITIENKTRYEKEIYKKYIDKMEGFYVDGTMPDVLVFDFRDNDKNTKNIVRELHNIKHEVIKVSKLINNKNNLDANIQENPYLTNRETDVLKLIAKGLSYNEIAKLLILSAHTVTTHIKNIYRKLSVHSRGEATFEAIQLGIISA